MITIKPLTDCTIAEAVTAWNSGFEGYYFNVATTPELFINRMVNEDISPTLSLVAFHNDQPVGIINNSIRIINGNKVSWNGGTAVAASFRHQGIGKLLMETTLTHLQRAGVDIAVLEAVHTNQAAIALYTKLGYSIVDHVAYLHLNGKLATISLPLIPPERYSVERVIPRQIGELPFYKAMNPWQTQWQSAKNSEAILLKNTLGEPIGYAYYRRSFDEQGIHTSTTLFQCEVKPEYPDAENATYFLLAQVFHQFADNINRAVPNIPTNNDPLTYNILKRIGFEVTARQVYMMNNHLINS